MIEWPEYDYDYRELPGVCWLSKGIELYSACVEGLFRTSQTLHLSGKSNNSVSLHIAQHDRPFHKQNAMNICTKFKTVFLFFSSYEYIFLGDITKWKRHVRCTAEQPTCSRWPRTGAVRWTDYCLWHPHLKIFHSLLLLSWTSFYLIYFFGAVTANFVKVPHLSWVQVMRIIKSVS